MEYDKCQTDKQDLLSVCGTDCGACYCFGKMCNGCNACEGKVFHAPEGKACPIYDCKIWAGTRDPKYTDEEFNANVAMRVQALGKSE